MSIWPFKDKAHPLFQRFSKAERRTMFDACCDIVSCDREVTVEESLCLVRIGELLGYKPDKSVKLFKKAQQALLGDAEKRGREAASGFAKFRRKDVEVLSLLISAAMADDRVKPEEEVWVHGFGKWLGFTKEEVQDILDESIQAKIRMTSR